MLCTTGKYIFVKFTTFGMRSKTTVQLDRAKHFLSARVISMYQDSIQDQCQNYEHEKVRYERLNRRTLLL